MVLSQIGSVIAAALLVGLGLAACVGGFIVLDRHTSDRTMLAILGSVIVLLIAGSGVNGFVYGNESAKPVFIFAFLSGGVLGFMFGLVLIARYISTAASMATAGVVGVVLYVHLGFTGYSQGNEVAQFGFNLVTFTAVTTFVLIALYAVYVRFSPVISGIRVLPGDE